jgi:hypothetical protein
MVTVTGFKTMKAKDGRDFTLLELQGGLEMCQSKETSRFYATVRRCSVSTTFDEVVAKSLIGTQMPGKIVRVECEPYEYAVENTGEIITLAHRWGYWPEGADAPMLEAVN